MRFLTQLFLNINLSVFYSLSAIRHEREFKCVRSVSEVKTNVIKRITSVQHTIIKTKHVFNRVSEVKAQHYSGKGGREQQLICI